MKHKVVLFSQNGARILTGIDPTDFEGIPNVAINPDLSEVKGIPPHHWQLVESKVLPLPEDKRTEPSAPSVTLHTLKASKTHYAIQAAIMVGVSLGVSVAVSLIFKLF